MHRRPRINTHRISVAKSKDRIMSTQVVLITGGLTGIERAAAVTFAKKGAKVVVSGRRDRAGQALVDELRSLGSEGRVHQRRRPQGR